jgi:hypothetical protein
MVIDWLDYLGIKGVGGPTPLGLHWTRAWARFIGQACIDSIWTPSGTVPYATSGESTLRGQPWIAGFTSSPNQCMFYLPFYQRQPSPNLSRSPLLSFYWTRAYACRLRSVGRKFGCLAQKSSYGGARPTKVSRLNVEPFRELTGFPRPRTSELAVGRHASVRRVYHRQASPDIR